MSISKKNKERLINDAIRYANKIEDSRSIPHYLAGATAEAKRTKLLEDALKRWIKADDKDCRPLRLYEVEIREKEILEAKNKAKTALERYRNNLK